MVSRRVGAGLNGSNRRVRIIVSGEVIQPLTDAEKLTRGYVTAAGDPKRAKVDLEPTDQVQVIQFEMYQREHRCQMCGGEQKSQRVLLLENLRTRERFHAAGDCLRFHFGLDIDAFFRASGLYGRVLEKLALVVGLEPETAGDTNRIIAAALARLERLERYETVAVSEARELLERVVRQPARAASGQLDAELQALDALIELQGDHSGAPERFADRWRALHGHPVLDELSGDHRDAVERAAGGMRGVSLRDHRLLVEALESARRSPVHLRNPAIRPWDYPDRSAYQAASRRWAEVQPHNERGMKAYAATSQRDQQRLQDRLQHALEERGSRRPISFWLTALEPSQLTRMSALPNEDTLVGRGAQITRTAVEVYYENPDDRASRRVRQGVCVFYFDRWYEAYAYWFRWREGGGRTALETLDQPPAGDVGSGKRMQGEPVVGGALGEAGLADNATDFAQEALRALPDYLRSLLGVDPTPAQLEVLRKPWLMVCIAVRDRDERRAEAAQADLADALQRLGFVTRQAARLPEGMDGK